MVKLNSCIFLLKIITYWKNLILFGIKSALIFKKKLVANLSAIKSDGKEATDFRIKKLPKWALTILVCLVVISLDSVLKKS